MLIETTDLLKGYREIVMATKDGFVLSKPNDIDSSIEVAFVDDQFYIQKEIRLQGYRKHKNKLIINPNNTSTFGYLTVDSVLQIYDCEGMLQKQLDMSCANAAFDDNDYLYIAERIDAEHLLLSVLDRDFEPLATFEVADPIYESIVDFEYHRQLQTMFLSLAGGQDGCVYYTLDWDRSKIVLKEFAENMAIIETDSSSKRFLSIDPYSCSINYYTYPDLELISSFDYLDYFEEGDLNFSLIYLQDGLFIIFFDGIPYIYDAQLSVVGAELQLEGHLPQPIKEFYPNLSDENRMTDIEIAQRFGSVIGFTTISGTGFYVCTEDLLFSMQ